MNHRHCGNHEFIVCLTVNTNCKIKFVCVACLGQAFGGPTLEDMYVTSAFIDLTDEQRQQAANAEAGKVFRITGHGAQGLPPHRHTAHTNK